MRSSRQSDQQTYDIDGLTPQQRARSMMIATFDAVIMALKYTPPAW